jgi:hypothetical protein
MPQNLAALWLLYGLFLGYLYGMLQMTQPWDEIDDMIASVDDASEE